MKNKIRDFILKTIAVIFSILFAIVLFNTIFFNKTIGINYKIPVIIIFTIIVYGIILFLYYIYTKKENSKDWIIQNDLYFNLNTGNEEMPEKETWDIMPGGAKNMK